MSDAHTTASGVASLASSLVAVAAGASVLWVVVEFAIRRGLTAPIGDALGTTAAGSAVTLALTGVVLAPTIAYLGTRVDVHPADWGLSLSVRGVLEGVGAVVAYYAFVVTASVVAVAAFGVDPAAGTSGFGFDGPTWALAALLVANGVLAPIAEEVAWRGVVQTALTEAVGVAAAIAVTAVVFAAKHVVVDFAAPPLRVASLVFLAVAFGVLRHRNGTGSAIVAHVLANTTATVGLLLA
ncbi:CPBP family intramembrane metalloprotease [Halorubellus sp. JP-L1]|uniref:CPBP family intramembrane glutamic endopeptidase n=1 Tax=Halorubellus sp. JP-L1 TaxID=2715753 RepID=UPI00140A74E7|nr:CPBP family intramembrane glutamic endopeptidase [Halorubellus sp. JP-L1]NHN43312.1 CPBP family intramembrane metalloprotease [Halorubellus sp. JP-L1]